MVEVISAVGMISLLLAVGFSLWQTSRRLDGFHEELGELWEAFEKLSEMTPTPDEGNGKARRTMWGD
jgi:hypothetical protein